MTSLLSAHPEDVGDGLWSEGFRAEADVRKAAKSDPSPFPAPRCEWLPTGTLLGGISDIDASRMPSVPAQATWFICFRSVALLGCV